MLKLERLVMAKKKTGNVENDNEVAATAADAISAAIQ